MTPNASEIKKTMDVGDHVSRVPASDALVQRLKQIPSTVQESYAKVPKKVVWAVAASIALLIALNVLSARDYAKNQGTTVQNTSYFDHLKTL